MTKQQMKLIKQWPSLTPEEKKRRYLESIPEQVSASMAFEGKPVNVGELREYLKALS